MSQMDLGAAGGVGAVEGEERATKDGEIEWALTFQRGEKVFK